MSEQSVLDVAALKEQIFGVKTDAAQPSQNQTAQTETPPVEVPTTEPTSQTATPETTPTTPQEDIVDLNAFLKEHFGVEDINTVKSEWENLSKLKANPPKAEVTYKDEYSKRIAEYLQNGKEDEVYQSLSAKRMLKDVDAMNDEQKLKLYIKMQNPLFDQELIDYSYQKMYGFDENNFKDEEGKIVDPLGYRYAKTESLQKQQNDIQKAVDYFSQYKGKIDLPNIQTQTQPDENYAQYQKWTDEANKKYDELTSALSKVSQDSPSRKFSFNDEANKIKFDIDYKMDQEGYKKAVDTAAQYLIVSDKYYAQDGSLLLNDLVWDIYQSQNRDKMIGDIISQSVSNALASFVANQKNIRLDTQRQNQPQVEMSDVVKEIKSKVFGQAV